MQEKLSDKTLVEYQKAQDSAEHYNNMIWTLMSLGVAASLLILNKFWTDRPEILYSLVLLFMGSFILFYFSYLIENAHEKKEWKYGICKRIEKDYSFIGQNFGVETLPISKLKMGMKIFRIMKFILFFLYLLTIIFALGLAYKENKITTGVIVGTIMVIFAIIGSFVVETYYCLVKKISQ